MSPTTELIWKAFSERLRKFIRVRVADEADAEDLLQEVFIRIHTRIDTLKDDTRLTAWVYQIARNLIIDYYRSRRESAYTAGYNCCAARLRRRECGSGNCERVAGDGCGLA